MTGGRGGDMMISQLKKVPIRRFRRNVGHVCLHCQFLLRVYDDDDINTFPNQKHMHECQKVEETIENYLEF